MPSNKISQSIHFMMVALAFALPLSIAATNLIGVIIVILWFLQGDIKKSIEIIKKHSLLLLPLLLPLIFLISWTWSDSATNSFLTKEGRIFLKGILSFAWIPLIAIILVTSIEKRYISYIIRAFLVAIFISEIASYLIYFELIEWQTIKEYGLLYRNTSPSSPTPFMNHIRYSLFLGIALLLLIDTLRKEDLSLYARLFIVFFIISATTNLFINGGRTGQIGIIIALGIYTIIVFRTKIWLLLSSWIAIIAVVFIAYNASPIFQKRVHAGISNIQGLAQKDYTTSWGLRVAAAKISLGYLAHSFPNLVLGAGAGNSRGALYEFANDNYPPHIAEPFKTLSHLHNQYLQFWIDGGVAALGVFLFFFYTIFKRYTIKNKPLIYSATGFFLFAFCTDNVLFSTQGYILFLLFYAIYLIYDEVPREKNYQSSNKQTS